MSRKTKIEKIEIINDIDKLFYDIENIEDQANILRSILTFNEIGILKGIKAYIQDKSKGGQ